MFRASQWQHEPHMLSKCRLGQTLQFTCQMQGPALEPLIVALAFPLSRGLLEFLKYR
jgi:hypothetical protein